MPPRTEVRRRKKDRDRDRDDKRSSGDKHSKSKTSHSSRSHRRNSSPPHTSNESLERTKTLPSERPSSSRRRTSSPRQRSFESLERTKASVLDRLSSSTPPPKVTVAGMERRPSTASPGSSRTGSLPYPSFSKAHSKEAIGARDINPRLSLYTPEHTDVGRDSSGGNASASPKNAGVTANAPPSPPLTNPDGEVSRQPSGASMRKAAETAKEEMETGRHSMDGGARPMKTRPFTTSQSSLRNITDANSHSQTSNSSHSNSTTLRSSHETKRSVSGPSTHASYRSASDSDRTSIAPEQPTTSRNTPSIVLGHGLEAEGPGAESPSTPIARSHLLSPTIGRDNTNGDILAATGLSREPFMGPRSDSVPVQPGSVPPPPPLPPPPPPVISPGDIPRVDYLMQKGGLSHLVPKTLLAAAAPQQPVQTYQYYSSPKPYTQPPVDIFAPFFKLLDDYVQVVQAHGSLAVATGYKSVARRLLDRLEEVFQRNISSETCDCIMCQSNPPSTASPEEDSGISWGEILELVSGRRELPQWPPFTIKPDKAGLGISGFDQQPPMQTLDVDVPDEYREHYIKQSKKTKTTVQNWLASQPEAPSSPPAEVDNETLTFAMFTHLEPETRRVFVALLKGTHTLPKSRTPTPMNGNAPQSELMAKVSLALTRVYRLARPPRDPETAVFLLKNPQIHDVLATIAAISPHEWDILVSGRFNGFLWSGAEVPTGQGINSPMASRGPSRGPTATPASRTTTPFSTGNGPSRGTTPFYDQNPYPQNIPSRGPTPASARSANFPQSGTPGLPSASTPAPAPIGFDEEVEITVLAEVERNLYQDMETLENAFEALHSRAEIVRRAFRERNAALSLQAQLRRGGSAEGVQVRMSTPASCGSWYNNGDVGSNGWAGAGPGWDSETESLWGMDDQRSELAPDDSASNISYNRTRGQSRKKERRTPVLREEDEESVTEM